MFWIRKDNPDRHQHICRKFGNFLLSLLLTIRLSIYCQYAFENFPENVKYYSLAAQRSVPTREETEGKLDGGILRDDKNKTVQQLKNTFPRQQSKSWQTVKRHSNPKGARYIYIMAFICVWTLSVWGLVRFKTSSSPSSEFLGGAVRQGCF